jgi:hypothetical protein
MTHQAGRARAAGPVKETGLKEAPSGASFNVESPAVPRHTPAV